MQPAARHPGQKRSCVKRRAGSNNTRDTGALAGALRTGRLGQTAAAAPAARPVCPPCHPTHQTRRQAAAQAQPRPAWLRRATQRATARRRCRRPRAAAPASPCRDAARRVAHDATAESCTRRRCEDRGRALKVTSAHARAFLQPPWRRMAARLRPRCLRELAQRLSRSCATAAADAPPPPLAAAAKRPPRTPIDAEIVSHARKLRVDPHLFSGAHADSCRLLVAPSHA